MSGECVEGHSEQMETRALYLPVVERLVNNIGRN
jgi:hypothetical protein